ncbi:group II intron reverse transcriptase/maturase [Actinomadura harenae]|uniref:Group II intron reverse transcriptase/maturase n=2 Tax=Actinomadura harenae TaxID=2483351 RepID=A0A3M2KYA0_9ACTN|nr:group II intron reverse transcriptase/maturase [Actinomadura harenae]
MMKTSVLKDKLDAADASAANGPEGGELDWQSIDWDAVGDDVRRLRQRIFTATREGDLKKVRNLQKLMLRSRANALVAVRRVAEINAGRMTPGIDGVAALTAPAKASLAEWAQSKAMTWKPKAVRRVYIPKSNGKQRPLGIPVIKDRAVQALVLNALEPEWEAKFEPKSYGFRPGRGCHDAIEAIFKVVRGPLSKRRWILDADLAAAFDRIDHDRLTSMLASFPARGLIREWLKAGVIENGRFAPTAEGTPQGGVISPLLLNVALHGMEEAAGVRYRTDGVHAGKTAPASPVLIRYADDFVVLCHSRRQADEARRMLAEWLAPRGLRFNEDKTQVVHLAEGFDFLGFNVRQYKGSKVLIKPSPAAVARFRKRLRAELRAMRGVSADDLVAKLNPILRGWAAYYRIGVSKKTFSNIDNYLWWATYKWARFRHPNKSKKWVVKRYFGSFDLARQVNWVFGDSNTGRYLIKIVWTPIVRHVMVQGNASPDDPQLAEYWARRRRKTKLPLSADYDRMLRWQRGRCPLCNGYLLHTETEPQHPDDWERWIAKLNKVVRASAVTDRLKPSREIHDRKAPKRELLHAHCARRRIAAKASAPEGFATP